MYDVHSKMSIDYTLVTRKDCHRNDICVSVVVRACEELSSISVDRSMTFNMA